MTLNIILYEIICSAMKLILTLNVAKTINIGNCLGWRWGGGEWRWGGGGGGEWRWGGGIENGGGGVYSFIWAIKLVVHTVNALMGLFNLHVYEDKILLCCYCMT